MCVSGGGEVEWSILEDGEGHVTRGFTPHTPQRNETRHNGVADARVPESVGRAGVGVGLVACRQEAGTVAQESKQWIS